MKRLMIAVLGLTCMARVAVAGNIDSPGSPSAGSGMYTLQNLYDYLMSGTALTVAGSFQEPAAAPGSTMKTTKEIGDGIKGQFDQCDATAANVQSGKKFFSTQSGSWGVKTGTYAPYCTLLKTGQTSVYRTGDDGSYSSSKGKALSYSWDSGTDTVKDNITGLIWASSGTGAGCKSGSVLNWTSAVDWAEGLVFAGYSDWRLPNVTELQSLVQRNSTYLNTTYFSNGGGTAYWSSTTRPNDSTYAFILYFSLAAAASPDLKTNATDYRVRAVRGGE